MVVPSCWKCSEGYTTIVKILGLFFPVLQLGVHYVLQFHLELINYLLNKYKKL